MKKAKKMEDDPSRKAVVSCSICGEYGHIKTSHKEVKWKATCSTCDEKGHWRNSNKTNKSSANDTTVFNADCKKWKARIRHELREEAVKNAAPKEFDLKETKGISSSRGPVWPWLAPENVLPGCLHTVQLGIKHKPVKMLEKAFQKADEKKVDGITNRVDKLNQFIYQELNVSTKIAPAGGIG
eukprot:Lithocolla_globosa_v1_NODE_1881_length_2277_cov_195.480648.p1 type:complete len:183 gc:universal NODE_1881_length_2277_cov_195.480648:2222-1674(-)